VKKLTHIHYLAKKTYLEQALAIYIVVDRSQLVWESNVNGSWWEPVGRGSSPGTYIASKEGRGP
jgi:hypothetical protein